MWTTCVERSASSRRSARSSTSPWTKRRFSCCARPVPVSESRCRLSRITIAFFRYYFDAEDDAGRTTVVRTSFWFTMVMATFGLVIGSVLAPQISHLLFTTDSRANLVRAALVLVWAQMNYEQLTSLFRAPERSVAYVSATLVNVITT